MVSAVDGVDLGHVLEDGDELDSLSGSGGGEGGEFAEGCDVGAFVEDEQERRVERFAGLGGAVVGVGDDFLDEGCEEGLQSSLFVCGGAEVGGVVAAVEEVFRSEVGGHG